MAAPKKNSLFASKVSERDTIRGVQICIREYDSHLGFHFPFPIGLIQNELKNISGVRQPQ